ncbi:Hypothetical protein CINCED_3A018685 [Cinara cedri]|uniref:Uncharacterized protein n=1 Tax=Cinara cedri TaxID=506608 RepID=A0A5E4MVS3_9HEMI|nr:Hypothetical protein CINCED_3A018685 [Cinara cedri]
MKEMEATAHDGEDDGGIPEFQIDKEGPRTGQQPPPLLRSSTLPAIIVPGFNILQAQIGPNSTTNGIYRRKLDAKINENKKELEKFEYQTEQLNTDIIRFQSKLDEVIKTNDENYKSSIEKVEIITYCQGVERKEINRRTLMETNREDS